MDTDQKLCLGYKEALAQLRQHPNIIWTRNNFFLLIQSGLLAFTLNIENRSSTDTRFVACVSGLFLAVIWLWVNLAGQRLQRQWRAIVRKFEERIFDKVEGEEGVIGPFHHTQEGKQFFLSITSALITLSIGFIILWILLLLRMYL